MLQICSKRAARKIVFTEITGHILTTFDQYLLRCFHSGKFLSICFFHSFLPHENSRAHAMLNADSQGHPPLGQKPGPNISTGATYGLTQDGEMASLKGHVLRRKGSEPEGYQCVCMWGVGGQQGEQGWSGPSRVHERAPRS